MKIVLLNQFFWPDSAATSQLLTDLARGLAAEGHSVYVISADGGYAPSDATDAPPVQVHRVKALRFVRGRVGRVLSYASFFVAAAWQSITMPRPDLVVTLTTPPLLSLLGNLLKSLRGARHVIWEMDMYPDVAVDVGYFKAGGMADRVTGLMMDWSRHHADGVVALGECMKDRLIRRGVPAAKIHVAENWADSRAISVLPRQGSVGELKILYSGNLGLAHDLDTVVGAIRWLRHDSRFRFIFVGSGGRKDELVAIAHAEALSNVELRPYVQRMSLGESLAVGDIGLVTQRDTCCGSVVPSKIYGLLAAGRPVLFVGPADAGPARIVKRFQCGWHVSCGDVKSLIGLLGYLAEHPGEVEAAGQRAREALVQHYDLPIGVARIVNIVGANTDTSKPEQIVFQPANFTQSQARS